MPDIFTAVIKKKKQLFFLIDLLAYKIQENANIKVNKFQIILRL